MPAPDDNLAMLGMMNPAYLFSSDQLQNQFSNFNNQPFPFPPSYVGSPNTATGAPNPNYRPPAPVYTPPTPGTTLNSTPGLGSPVDRWNQGMAAAAGYTGGDPQRAALLSAQLGLGPMYYSGGGGQQQPQAQPASAGGWSTPNNWSSVLSALANPGQQQTYGSTARPAPSIIPPAVANMTGGTGAGGRYTNVPMVNTMKGFFGA